MNRDRRDRIGSRVNLACVGLNLAIAVWNLTLGDWVIALVSITVAIVLAIMWWSARPVWIDIGWMRARSDMFASLHEAHRRGWTFAEWYMAEIERTAVDHKVKPPRRRNAR